MLTDNKPKSFQSWADEMDELLPFDKTDNEVDEGELHREIDNVTSHFDVSLKQASAESNHRSFGRVDREEEDPVGDRADNDDVRGDTWIDDPAIVKAQDLPLLKSDAMEVEIMGLPLDTLHIALMCFIVQPVINKREREKNKVGILCSFTIVPF